jgi:glycine dehydrogenase
MSSATPRTEIAEPNQSDPTDARGHFVHRHLGPDEAAIAHMLKTIGLASLDELLDEVVPEPIRFHGRIELDTVIGGAGHGDEARAIDQLRGLAQANRVQTSLIGTGWFGTFTPPVILRNLIENPAWYTAYTPYQPEISQGRLEMLLNFQTMVAELCGMQIANSSLLDEATAAAEAMTLARRQSSVGSPVFLVDEDSHPQVIDVIVSRAEPIGLQVRTFDVDRGMPDTDAFGVLLAYPGSSGSVRDLSGIAEEAHALGRIVCVTTDLLALTLLAPPGEWGADVVVGSAQRFGVPMGFGGPHAGFMATRDEFRRSLPGRLVGVSVDAEGRPALRLALQTREQHIRREKATSNICTAQVLLANVAAAYAVYHGPEGLEEIARRVHSHTAALHSALVSAGVEVENGTYFDTLRIRVPGRAAAVVSAALDAGINLRRIDDDHVGVSFDELTTSKTVADVAAAFGVAPIDPGAERSGLPEALIRTTEFLTHPNFHDHRSETAMMRYLRRLADADLALDRTMIPLGSCTMKLNAVVEMMPITWPQFADIHPFAPADQVEGYLTLIEQIEAGLCRITGYDAVSLQPNAGSQGELAGLLAIAAYHRERGEGHRRTCLIPASAHGTNAASAVMAGMEVVVVATDPEGNVDLDDLRDKAAAHAWTLSAVMVTYPSTHGVFEQGITELCEVVHSHGGQVYLDGANLNALVGVALPGAFGADVSHLNLHKTFCIPHGGGGPGVGPVAVRSHLAPYLPGHRNSPRVEERSGVESGARPVIAAAPFGSASILPISWTYLVLMGEHLRTATAVAMLSANYLARRLSPHYPVLYTGRGGYVAHECILDLREITKASGVTAEDVAKRLIDYGFHAPTLSFPVAGTLMVEPTESEDLDELDRFCEAMIAIRDEIRRVEGGEWPADDNPLRNAPHTAARVTSDEWSHPYSRTEAAWPGDPNSPDGPTAAALARKYWAPVARIDGGYGDRNLVCSCPPVEELAL